MLRGGRTVGTLWREKSEIPRVYLQWRNGIGDAKSQINRNKETASHLDHAFSFVEYGLYQAFDSLEGVCSNMGSDFKIALVSFLPYLFPTFQQRCVLMRILWELIVSAIFRKIFTKQRLIICF